MKPAIRILAVDDDPLILNFVKATLGSEYELMTTASWVLPRIYGHFNEGHNYG